MERHIQGGGNGRGVSGCPLAVTLLFNGRPSPEAKSDKILRTFIEKENQDGLPGEEVKGGGGEAV